MVGETKSKGKSAAAAVISVALVASGAAAAAPAFAAPRVVTAVKVAPLVSGVLEDSAGNLAGTGQDVVAFALPSITAESVGDEPLALSPVGLSTTGGDGAFSIAWNDPSEADAAANSSGLVNVMVASIVDGELAVINLPVAAPSGTAAASKLDLSATAQLPSSEIVLRAGKGAGVIASKSVAARTSAGESSVLSPLFCSDSVIADHGSRNVEIGNSYTVPGTTSHVTYTAGQSSTLGVGVSTSGADGSWDAQGSMSQESTAAVAFPIVSGTNKTEWYSGFHYREHLYNCSDTTGAHLYYQEQADSFAGGTASVTPTGYPPAPYCTNYLAGSDFFSGSKTQATYSTGARTSGAIGINLSVQTGFSTDLQVHYHFADAHRLCGANDYPGGQPKRVRAES